MCVNLRAPWQGKLAKMPNLYLHSRKHSQQDCLLKNRRGTTLRISRARLSTELLSQKSKRHRSLNLKSQTPNRIAFSKIEKIPQTTFSKRSDKVKTCEACSSHFIAMTKNAKGIALLLAQKSKRHRPPNLKSQTPNRITFSKIEEAPLSKSQEPDSQQDCFLKNRRGTALRISRARSPTGLLVRKPKRHRSPNFES
ncbi:hypothetical protein ACFX2K_028567 [Malus domestica]